MDFEITLPQWMAQMVDSGTWFDIIGLTALWEMLQVSSSFILIPAQLHCNYCVISDLLDSIVFLLYHLILDATMCCATEHHLHRSCTIFPGQ